MNKVLLAIIFLAAVLRLYNLGSIPPHLTPDEASLGYNAYSILKTGRDEYGQLLPIVFKSFGDYKPGLYIYTTIPFVAILGLNEFSVRLSGAIAGIIAVYLIYLISKELFKDQAEKVSKQLGLLAALLLAISPWSIHFSRGAWEVNLALTLTLAGIYFFLKSLTKQRYLIISVLLFALTTWAYQGAKLSSALVIFILLILWGKKVFRFDKKIIIKSIAIGILVSVPIILSVLGGRAGRLNVFSVFSYPRPEAYLQNFLDQGDEKVGDISYYLFHSERYNFFRGVMGRYFNHFSTRFLFFEGDWQNPRHSPPNHGMFLIADIVLLISGVVVIARNISKKEYLFVIAWLLLAPLPAVLSRDQIHAVRSLNMVIPLTIILAMGLNKLMSNKKHLWKIGLLVFAVFYLVNYTYYLDAYFVHLPKHDSKNWEYGYKQIVKEISPIQNNYSQIKVQQSYAQPYIYFLFFQKYDPAKYQSQAKLKESEFGDVGQVEKLDNICFCALDWSVNRGDKGTLVIGDPVRIPPEDSKDEKQFNILKEIKYLNGTETAFRIIEVKK